MQLCDAREGSSLRFSDVALQKKFDRLLMKGSRDILKNTLLKTQSRKPSVSLLQDGESKHLQPASAKTKTPVTSGQNDEFGDMKCGPIPDCGLLYDTLSLEWGGYKDQVDELKKIMADNQAAWEALRDEFNDQIATLNAQKKQCGEDLALATKKKTADQQELAEKQGQKRN